jgi:TFIIF-interacting CTD phosphatase-like protein
MVVDVIATSTSVYILCYKISKVAFKSSCINVDISYAFDLSVMNTTTPNTIIVAWLFATYIKNELMQSLQAFLNFGAKSFGLI